MGKQYEYKNMIITNVPYKSINRWFILNKDGSRATYESGLVIYPSSTLKDAKETIDKCIDKEK